MKSKEKKLKDKIYLNNKCINSVSQTKRLNKVNPKLLCKYLEKEFIDNHQDNINLINKVSIKHLLIRDNNEIIGPISTLNNEQIDTEQYEKFKKNNKLLEYIVVFTFLLLVEKI